MPSWHKYKVGIVLEASNFESLRVGLGELRSCLDRLGGLGAAVARRGVERSIVVAVAQISSPRLDAALAIVATVAQISSQRFDSGAGDYWHCSRISSQGLLAIIVDCFTCSLESCLDVNGTFDSTIGRREEEAYEPRYGPSSTQRRRNTGEAQPPWLSSLLEALQDSDPAIENDDLLVITGNGSVRMHQAALMEQMRQSVSSGLIGSLSTVKSRPSEDGKWPTQDRWNRTMLVKIYGAFTVISGDAVNHIVLMQYLKPPGNVVSQYQLKPFGSKMEPVYLAGLEYLRFEEIVKRDTQFLQDDSVVDYSLLCFKTENREVVVGVVDFFGRRTLRKSLKLLVERPSWMRLRQALVTPCVYHSFMRSKIDMVFYMFVPEITFVSGREISDH
ncbi:hypothetical protein SELMODRAFT_405969 [Selaginella moellendorffii]|uniref:PIPK domain-containing protein n=1 Tax=Selaginella moellendorffii TaxID=88036 RepID=D8R089_SELML|nr:hypothetical protein SELMODRAFT_405969 [Selaginella moellendorffii]